MRGSWRAVLGVAMLWVLAGPAGAAIMEAQMDGDWATTFNYRSWAFDIVYDTSLATESAWTDPFGALGDQLTWTLGDGPSPVISETVTYTGYKSWEPWLGDFDTFTPIPDKTDSILPDSFQILQSTNIFLIQGFWLLKPLILLST